jgi:hypothetical protein
MMANGAVLSEPIIYLGVLNCLIGRDATFAGNGGADDGMHVVFLTPSLRNERAESLYSTKVKTAFLRHAPSRVSEPFFVLSVGDMDNRIGRGKESIGMLVACAIVSRIVR